MSDDIKANMKKWLSAIDKFKETDYRSWFQFSMAWFAFNGYYSKRYKHISRESNQIIEFAKDNTALFEQLRKSKLSSCLDEFKKTKTRTRTEVKDLRENPRAPKRFDDKNQSCEHFFLVLYQIRCNFFHGDKQPYFTADKKLVEWANKYLNIVLIEFLKRENKS